MLDLVLPAIIDEAAPKNGHSLTSLFCVRESGLAHGTKLNSHQHGCTSNRIIMSIATVDLLTNLLNESNKKLEALTETHAARDKEFRKAIKKAGKAMAKAEFRVLIMTLKTNSLLNKTCNAELVNMYGSTLWSTYGDKVTFTRTGFTIVVNDQVTLKIEQLFNQPEQGEAKEDAEVESPQHVGCGDPTCSRCNNGITAFAITAQNPEGEDIPLPGPWADRASRVAPDDLCELLANICELHAE